MSVRGTLKRLEQLGELCGSADSVARAEEAAREAARLERMTPYERFEYNIRADVLKLQKLNLEAQELQSEGRTSGSDGVRLRNEIMKVKMRLQTQERAMPQARSDTERHHQHELKSLLQKIRKADRVKSSRLTDDPNAPLLGGRSSNGVTEIDVDDGTGFGGGGIPIMEDGEFQQFFDNVRQTDQRIDTELDRLHVGVTKLAESAKQITQELKVQEQIMVVTEQKMDDITTDLQKTNKKLRKAIKEVNKDKLCLYILCAIVLLGIVGAIVMMTDKK